MTWKRILLSLAMLLPAVGSIQAESPFMKQFNEDYKTLNQDLMNNIGETGTIKDFVYEKDVATVTFKEGTIFFLRYVKDRPTTAIFIGKGNATVEIPSHVERQALWYAARDSVVNENFDVCFIRMADDLDLKVKEKYKLEKKQLDWKNFTITKQAQGEFHFKPTIESRYDNYFELLRSVYERSADGYFFMDFGRYTYTFDPNLPEQSVVGFEHEPGDQNITDGAVMQRKERNIYDDLKMSDIAYPTTIVSRTGSLVLSGLEGTSIDKAQIDCRIVVNGDSLKFMSIFLHYFLSLDSMAVDGVGTEFTRRSDFNFIGVVLPTYYHKGDTMTVRIWYHGGKYWSPLPYVENPAATAIKINFDAPSEFSYVMPGMGQVTRAHGRQTFTVEPDQPINTFVFRPYASGFDSTEITTSVGIPLTVLKSPDISKTKYDCYITDDMFQKVVKEGVEFIGARLGNPPGTFGMDIYPLSDLSVQGWGNAAMSYSADFTSAGWVEVPQVYCLTAGDGQLQIVAGPRIAREWFGEFMRPATEREAWLGDAVCEYLGLWYVQGSLPGDPFYTEMVRRRQNFDVTYLSRDNDRPLATGERVSDSLHTTKGAWVIHMLRQLMFSLDPADKDPDQKFRKFLTELESYVNFRAFTNADVERIAEKYYGDKLDWFFNYWLYGRHIPEFNVKYSFEQKGSDWFVNGTVNTKGVDGNFQMPVIMSVTKNDGNTDLSRQLVKGTSSTFQIGPFPAQPKDFKFNEYFSVLSMDDVSMEKK